MNDTPTPTNDEWIVTDNENYIEIASIKTCDSIASVHGGKTIGDQYDLAGRIARVPQLERELTAAREELKAVTEQRDGLRSGIDCASDQLHRVTEQRDRLIEVIKAASVLIAAKGRHNTMLAYNGLRDALQSLNQPTQ